MGAGQVKVSTWGRGWAAGAHWDSKDSPGEEIGAGEVGLYLWSHNKVTLTSGMGVKG